MSANITSVTDEELARHVAETADRLKRLCEALGWAGLASTLEMVVVEAERLAAGDDDGSIQTQ